MASIVKFVEELSEQICKEYVTDIEATMRANAPVYTGQVLASIRSERTGRWKWTIGPHTDHDYWAEYGNHANAPDGYIHAKNPYGMRWVDPQGRTHVARRVRPHEGSKFVEKTASKYR